MPKISIPMDIWLRFLGLYLSEGSCGGHGHIVNISQGNRKKQLVLDAMAGFPFKMAEKSGGFQIASVQLCSWLKKNVPGRCFPNGFQESLWGFLQDNAGFSSTRSCLETEVRTSELVEEYIIQPQEVWPTMFKS